MIEEFWNEYCNLNNLNNVSYRTAFQLGSEACKLAKLVQTGTKQATSSLYDLYQVYDQALPQIDDYHIVLNGNNYPVAIIKLTKISIVPFNAVTDEMTKLEGEGTPDYWRSSHERFFSSQVIETDIEFKPTSMIVFEQFKCVHQN